MFCNKCGANISSDSKFCTSCGAPVNNNGNEMGNNNFETNQMNTINNSNGTMSNMDYSQNTNFNGQNMMYDFNNDPMNKKGPNILFIIFGIVFAIAIAVLLFFLFHEDDSLDNYNDKNDYPNSSEVSNNDVNRDTGNNQENVSVSNNKFKSFEFPTPSGYVAKNEMDELMFTNDDCIIGLYEILNGYQVSDISLDKMKKSINNNGGKYISSKKAKVNGIELLVAEFSYSDLPDYNFYIGFINLGSSRILAYDIVIMGSSNTNLNKVLSDLGYIVKNATYGGSTNFAKTDTKDEFVVKVDKNIVNYINK